MMDPKVCIHYSCSKCEAPIQLDTGFSHLSEHTKAELGLPVFKGSEFELPSYDYTDADSFDRLVPHLTLSQESSEQAQDFLLNNSGHRQMSKSAYGFTVLGCPTNAEEKTSALKVTNQLLDLASCNSSVDHPLCEECTDALLMHVEEQLVYTSQKSKCYSKLLEELQQIPPTDTCRLENELAELEREEAALQEEIKAIMEEQKQTEALLEEKQKEAIKLADEEERYREEYCKQRSLWCDAEEERISVYNQLFHSKRQLDKLKQNNIFNIAFHIWMTDHVCTINNFRLGKLPTVSVSPQEINAALGQMTLLLVSLARKCDISFSKYKIVPYGNHSFLEVKTGEHRVLPLHSNTGFKMFDHSFDQALMAFLECFVEFVQQRESKTKIPVKLPYPIVKHCLEDSQGGGKYSIKTQFNPDEQWTKALKFLLTNLKWALTWVSAPDPPQHPGKAA